MKPTKAGLLATAALMTAVSAQAETLRWGSARDIYSLDPYSYGDSYTIAFMNHVYEALVRYDENLEIEGALATEWEIVSPAVWRFHLREGVKFQDGAEFTADDVIASLTRVSDPASPLKGNLPAYKSATKVDDYTVDIELTGPYPLLLNDLTNILIFDADWLKDNDAEKPSDAAAGVENYATNNANGTGPFIVESRTPDAETVLIRNEEWWDEPRHNIDRIEFKPITSAPTRVAALLSGEINFTEEAPVQDLERLAAAPGVTLMETPSLRTIMFGFNRKPELEDGRKNPFNDLRVRQAFDIAIDRDLLAKRVFRGKARPSGSMVAPEIPGYAEALDAYPAADAEKARALLAEAGHEGLAFTLVCTNDAYVNDEELCRAVVSMLSRAGFNPTLDSAPQALQTPKRAGGKSDVYIIGWATLPMMDAYSVLQQIIHTKGEAWGVFNWGSWSYPEIDTLIEQASTEMDREKRLEIETEALTMAKEELVMLPLYQQPMAWAMSEDIESVMQNPDNKARHWLTKLAEE